MNIFKNKKILLCFLLGLILCLFFTGSGFASTPVLAKQEKTEQSHNGEDSQIQENKEENANNSLDKLLFGYKSEADNWFLVFKKAARNLFVLLVTIELSWTFIGLALKQADMSQFIAEFTKKILFIGFFLTLLEFGPEFARAIINTFSKLGQGPDLFGAKAVGASDMFDTGLNFVSRMLNNTDWLNPVNSLGMIMAAIIVMVCFALIAGVITIVQVEMYIVLGAGVIFLGFGGCRWTSDYAKNYMLYSLSVGVKLMTLFLLGSTGQKIIAEWIAPINQITMIEVLTLIGGCVIYLSLILSIPKIMASLVNGSNYGSEDALMRTTSMVSSIATGAAVAGSSITKMGVKSSLASTGGVMAAKAAYGAAKATGASGFKSVGKAMSGIAGSALKGAFVSKAGSTVGGKMASDITNKMKEELEENRNS